MDKQKNSPSQEVEMNSYLSSVTNKAICYALCILYFCPPLGCGHCKALAPTYEQLGEAFATSDDVVIAKVDADSDKTLSSRFGVSGFPTLKYFPKGSTSAEE